MYNYLCLFSKTYNKIPSFFHSHSYVLARVHMRKYVQNLDMCTNVFLMSYLPYESPIPSQSTDITYFIIV